MVTRISKKQKAEMAFSELCGDGITPEEFVLKVMRGVIKLKNGRDQNRYSAAIALLPYRLPRLNSIDATTRNVEMSHDQWIKEMEGGGDA